MNSILPDPGISPSDGDFSIGFAPAWAAGLNYELYDELDRIEFERPDWMQKFLALDVQNEFGWMTFINWVYCE